ncbi:hypothetical protein ABZX99_32225 [Streptomyces antibioticus]|uniref:hypothetical protein n=1 Tax=Streptomyces antibioticus TaxID=1890 RepID=UPI0033A00D12
MPEYALGEDDSNGSDDLLDQMLMSTHAELLAAIDTEQAGGHRGVPTTAEDNIATSAAADAVRASRAVPGQRPANKREANGTTNPSSQGPITIGNVHNGTLAIGSHAYAVNHRSSEGRSDQATAQLLEAIRALRADLQRVRHTEQTAGLDAVLAATEEEIVATGHTRAGHREYLRAVLTASQTSVSALASAAAVAHLLEMG